VKSLNFPYTKGSIQAYIPRSKYFFLYLGNIRIFPSLAPAGTNYAAAAWSSPVNSNKAGFRRIALIFACF
jgi:hypothetical protein